MLASLGYLLCRERGQVKKECAQRNKWEIILEQFSAKLMCFSLGWIHWCKDQIVHFLWADASYKHHNTKNKEGGFPLLYFCSWLLSSGMQMNLCQFTFNERTKENGINLVPGNCFFSLCPGREVATLLFFSRLHTFLLLLTLVMPWCQL